MAPSPIPFALFDDVFQLLPNRALSDEGHVLAEVDQLYHRLSLSETTLTGSKWKAREQPTNSETKPATAQNRAPTDSVLIVYEATNSRQLTNSNRNLMENARLTRFQILPKPTHLISFDV